MKKKLKNKTSQENQAQTIEKKINEFKKHWDTNSKKLQHHLKNQKFHVRYTKQQHERESNQKNCHSSLIFICIIDNNLAASVELDQQEAI